MITIDLTISDEKWRALDELSGLIDRALGAAEAVAETPGEVSILLTDNDAMQALNAQFRDKDKPTDVLSFPAHEMDAPFLGDIAVGYEISAKDAAESGKTLSDHLSHLIIHGYLHLVGYDHVDEKEAEEMEDLERRALASIGIADPYSSE